MIYMINQAFLSFMECGSFYVNKVRCHSVAWKAKEQEACVRGGFTQQRPMGFNGLPSWIFCAPNSQIYSDCCKWFTQHFQGRSKSMGVEIKDK